MGRTKEMGKRIYFTVEEMENIFEAVQENETNIFIKKTLDNSWEEKYQRTKYLKEKIQSKIEKARLREGV